SLWHHGLWPRTNLSGKAQLRLVCLGLPLEGHTDGLQRWPASAATASASPGSWPPPPASRGGGCARALPPRGSSTGAPSAGQCHGPPASAGAAGGRPQPGQVVSRVARGPAVVRPGAVALGSGGFAHAVLRRGLSCWG